MNRKLRLGLCFTLGAAFGCGDDTTMMPVDDVNAAAEALGGSAKLTASTAISYKTTGKYYDLEESFSATGMPEAASDFDATQALRTSDLAQHGEWSGHSLGLLPGAPVMWKETGADKFGYIDGGDNIFAGPGRATVLSSRVTARRKQLLLASPGVLVRWALANKSAVTAGDVTDGGKSYRVLDLKGVPGSAQPVRLWLDPATHVPLRATTVEDDPIHGDTTFEVRYEAWATASSGVKMPSKLTHNYAGAVVQTEDRTMVADNPTLDTATFDVPSDVQGTYDEGLAMWGTRSSQYLMRFQGILLPNYADLSKAVMEKDIGNDMVFYSAGLYNTLAIGMPTYVVVVEAPLYESVSQAVIAKIKAHWPGKPIKYVINTHFHFDHSGGLRAYAAEGAEVLVANQVVSWFDASMKAPHTINPDALAKNPKTVKVTGVTNKMSITDGARTVTLYNITQGHSDGHLIAHVEDAKTLFVTDLYSPGLLGPNPMSMAPGALGKGAADFLAALGTLGLDETKITAFVGGHGGYQGTFTELRIFAGK